jgi:ATP-dependent exoDNAse (exonuclease V) alpha subunit
VEREWSIDQEKALLAIAEGVQQDDANTHDFLTRFLHVSGRPGVGKTEVIIHAAHRASQKGGQVLILCPSGTLVHVYRDRLGDMNGVTVETIHSAFQIGRNADKAVKYAPPSRLRRYDLIMLDEASQVDDEVCTRLFIAIRELPQRPFFVISADFQQLNPIGASKVVRELCKTVHTVDLVTVHRSKDDALLDFSNLVRMTQPSRHTSEPG